VSSEIQRGEVWTLADGRDVLVVSLSGLDEAYGAVLAIVLHPAGRYPDTAMSVVISSPIACTAVAVNVQQLAVATRFKGATCRGDVEPAVMIRVDQALRAVLDL
jgi:mRNA interferase MazF